MQAVQAEAINSLKIDACDPDALIEKWMSQNGCLRQNMGGVNI